MLDEIKEKWRVVTDYPSYKISNLGNVQSLKRNKPYMMKQFILKDGYLRVKLYSKNSCKILPVHKLVATHFIKNNMNFPIINHIDGNKKNNYYKNLEWCTYKYNLEHAFKNKLNNNFAENHHNSKLKWKDVENIRSLYKTGNYTQVKLAEIFNCSQSAITKIINKKNWKISK